MDIVYKKPISQTSYQLLRHAGYIPITDRETGKQSYVLKIDDRRYPRFHVYVKEETDNRLQLHLHLDNKQHGWTHSRHDSEYDGEQVMAEATRLIRWIKHFAVRK